MRLKACELDKIKKYLGREISADTEESLITELLSALDRKQEMLQKCAEVIDSLKAENERFRNQHSIRENTMMNVQRALGDFTIQTKLKQGLIFEEDIIDRLLNSRSKLDKFTVEQLKKINCNFKPNACLEEVIYELIMMVDVRNKTLVNQEKTVEGLNHRVGQGVDAIKEIERNFPGIFNILNEVQVVQAGGLPFDVAVDSLIKRCKQLESITHQKDLGRDPETDKIIALINQGYSKAAIIRMTGIGKNKVYRICKELGI